MVGASPQTPSAFIKKICNNAHISFLFSGRYNSVLSQVTNLGERNGYSKNIYKNVLLRLFSKMCHYTPVFGTGIA